MKVNDYVKYENEIVKIIEIREYFSEDTEDDYVLSNGKEACEYELKPLTPEETLEMFKGRFEEENCTLGYNKDNDYFSIKVNIRLDYSFCLSKENGISIYGVHNFVHIPYNLQLLCIEFQQWYWRDK